MTETLVTGGTGFIGPHLVAALAARGDRVRVLALPNDDISRISRENIAIYRGDLREPNTLTAAFDGADTVFNLAAAHGLWLPEQQ